MPPIKKCLCTLFFAALLLSSAVSYAGNGAIAIAVPVEGIAIDGDLSDWPAGMVEYPVTLREAGDPLANRSDFAAHFRLGFNAEENTLYVAVEVEDESVVFSNSGPESAHPPSQQDACEIYIDVQYANKGTLPVQYFMRADVPGVYPPERGAVDDFTVATQWEEDGYRFEWCVDITKVSKGKVQLAQGGVLGFDLTLWDRDAGGSGTYIADEEGSRTWMNWGPCTNLNGWKFASAGQVGKVYLKEKATELGIIHGQMTQSEDGSSYGNLLLHLDRDGKQHASVLADAEGRYQLSLLPGKYSLRPDPGAPFRALTDQTVLIRPGMTTSANLRLEPIVLPAILKKMLATYKQATEYQDSLTVMKAITSDGVDIQTQAPFRLAWQAPGRFRLEGWTEEERLVVSDGDSTADYRGSFQQYVKYPTTVPLVYYKKPYWLELGLPFKPPGLGLGLRLAMSDDPVKLLGRGLEKVDALAREVIGGRATVLVNLTQAPAWDSLAEKVSNSTVSSAKPLSLRLWIDEEDFTLRRASYQLDGTHYTEHYSRPDLQPHFDDATFVFEPPTGAAKTQGFGQGKEKELIGQPAPDFALKDYKDQEVRLADFAGQVVLVDFWATWCSPCLEVMPKLVALHEKYADQGFTIIGIAINDKAEAVKKYAAKNAIAFPLPLADETVAEAYLVQGLPTTFVVDRAGAIQFAQIGGAYPADFEKQIEDMLAE